MEWEQALEEFRLELRAAGRSSGTIKLRTTYLRRLWSMYPESRPFELDGEQLVRFMAAGEWGPETRKSCRSSLVAFYRWAMLAGHTSADPSRRLEPVPVPAGAPRPVPTRILQAALEQAKTDRERLVLLFAAYAGLRRAEIARVMPADFTEDGLRVRGKGGRTRLVPVHPDLMAAVRRELELRARGSHGTGWRFTHGIAVDGPLFPGRSGAGCSADNVGRILSRLLGNGWTGHTLRHRFASSAYAVERDLRAVQELLGHSNPTTTARYVQTPTTAKLRAVMGTGIGDAKQWGIGAITSGAVIAEVWTGIGA